MSELVKVIFTEFAVFIRPLNDAIRDEATLEQYLLGFGYAVGIGSLSAPVASLSSLADASQGLIDATSGDAQNVDIAAVAPLAQAMFSDLDGFGTAFETLQALSGLPNKAQNLALLPGDVLANLLTRYLQSRSETALRILQLLGLHEQISVVQDSDPRWRGARYSYDVYNWSRLGQLFRDPHAWGREVYGWGVDFDSNTALFRIGAVLETISSLVRLEAMNAAQIAHFLPNAVADGDNLEMIVAPLVAQDQGGAVAEFGAALFPVSGQQASDKGLALGPYAIGNVSANFSPFDNAQVTVTGAFGGLGGAILSMRPSGFSADLGVGAAAFTGEFGLDLAVSPPPPQSHIVLIGESDGTRLQIEGVSVKAGGEVTSASDFDGYVAGGVQQLTMVIDPSDDGLLGAVLNGPIEINAGDLALGWRPQRGPYFEGGSNLGIQVPVSLSLGPLNIHNFGIELDFDEPITVKVTTAADLTVGPLFAYADGIGVSASVVPAADNDGVFGKNDLQFGFVPPTAYALSLQSDVITGGGHLSIDDSEYRGALALKFQNFGFSAFAILNTELPGAPGQFSFAASIFGEFNVPLSFGFFLTGIGGIIGINRTIDTDAMRSVLYEGRLDNLLFPADPITNAASILEDMANIMPPRSGQHIIGPVVKIGWGQPILVEVTLGLMFEVGQEVRIVILGGLGMILPTKAAKIVDIGISFFGEIDFSARTISFDATLLNSCILGYPISGDSAIRTGWAPRLEHVASFGGLHPSYPKPSNLPDLKAITLAFGTNNPRVTISGYAALTSNSLQFGARADLYAKGPDLWVIGQLAAEGNVYLDALVYFDPFSFDVALGGGLTLLRNGNRVMSLGFSLRLQGPNSFYISGQVWATVLRKKVKFGITHRWGSRQTLAAPSADPVAVLRQALEKGRLEPVAPATRGGGISFADGGEDTDIVDPLGGVRFTQTAVPLDVTIQKIGEAQIPGGAARLDLAVFDAAGQSVVVSDRSASFVHGHFFRLTDAERLRATAFDDHKAGFELANAGLEGAVSEAIETDYGYEYVEIPVQTDAPPVLAGVLRPGVGLLDDILTRFNARELELREDYGRLGKLVPLSPVPRPIRDIYVSERQFEAAETFFEQNPPLTDPVGTTGAPPLRETIVGVGLAQGSFSGAQFEAQPFGDFADVSDSGLRHEANPVMNDYILAAGRL